MNNRIGEKNINNFGSKMTIVEYRKYSDITVEFEDGYRTKAEYGNFKRGAISSVYDKSIYGVGYIGEGGFKVSENGKATKEYTVWQSMIRRCYDSKIQAKYPTYKGCSVCNEWRNFQNFAEWYQENYYFLENEELHLDKDFLISGNKIYGSNTCIFLPKAINVALANKVSNNSTGYTGVVWNKRANKYVVRISKFGKQYNLGYFDTPIEASIVYQKERNKYLTELMVSYKSKLPKRIYNKIINTLVEQDIKIVA